MSPPLRSGQTVLLVDGYNILMAWPSLQKTARESTFDLARRELMEELSGYVAFWDYQATIIFDAYGQATPVHHEKSVSGIDIIFTGFGETADTYIERTCAQLQWADCRVRVATSDRIQQLVVGGYDAEWLSADQLKAEVRHAKQQIRRAIRASKVKKDRGIHSFLDANTLEQLNQWRIQGRDPRIT
jgi:predicted RNA-binding protein with PIN domain